MEIPVMIVPFGDLKVGDCVPAAMGMEEKVPSKEVWR
jgi:hypothetical protein